MSIKRLVAATMPGVFALAAAWPAAMPAAANPPLPPPQVMAHKGLHHPFAPAPENSVSAIVGSAALGVPTEIDILLSKSTQAHPYGVPFVFHDQTLRRMTNRAGYLADFTPTQLASTCLVTVPRGDICSDQRIPRLTTVLNRARAAGGPLDIEVKLHTLTWKQALVIVKRLEWADAWSWDTLPGMDDPLILSFWTQPLAQLRAVAAHRGDPPLVTEFMSVHPDTSAKDTAGNAMEALYFRNVTAGAVAQLHAMGLKVDAYTSNEAADWDKLAQAGVDWVMTDDVVGYQDWAAAR